MGIIPFKLGPVTTPSSGRVKREGEEPDHQNQSWLQSFKKILDSDRSKLSIASW